MHNFRKLVIWQKAIDFVTDVYVLTRKFPQHEVFGLSSQIQRAAISIPLNIAEGSAKSSNKDFSRFLEMAVGSSYELESAIIITHNLKYIDAELMNNSINKLTELQIMILSFKNNLE